MAELRGVVELRLCNVGTKSEGTYAYLNCDEGVSYILYREGEWEVNDSYFVDYAGKECVVEGQIDGSKYLCVSSIAELVQEQEVSEQETQEDGEQEECAQEQSQEQEYKE
ncbi:MAG: hypothetical protein SNH13_05135 [Rikenellaceae bacterium]